MFCRFSERFLYLCFSLSWFEVGGAQWEKHDVSFLHEQTTQFMLAPDTLDARVCVGFARCRFCCCPMLVTIHPKSLTACTTSTWSAHCWKSKLLTKLKDSAIFEYKSSGSWGCSLVLPLSIKSDQTTLSSDKAEYLSFYLLIGND